MTFSKIFNNTEISPEEQLEQLITLVNTIRIKYGNAGIDIPEEDPFTTSGGVPMAMLSAESRVAVAHQDVQHLVAIAYEDEQATIGINFDRRLEELVSISPVLNSLSNSLGSEYLA